MKKISPKIKIKIVELSKCFWYWNSFYTFYSSILGVSKRKLAIQYPKDLYNKYSATEKILEILEENGNIDKITEIISNFYNLDKPFDKNDNPNYKEALIELKEFKQIVGKDIFEEEKERGKFIEQLNERKNRDNIEREKSQKLENIKDQFLNFAKVTLQEDKQKRGYWLEKVFYELLQVEQIEHSKPYKKEYEQIDGHFRFKSFDYLVEIKWTDSLIIQKDISIFEGKLSTKGQSTRGFILSIAGFDQSAIQAAKGKNPRLIFMDGAEFLSILEERSTFYDIMHHKEYNLVKFGKVYKE